ncbi:citrate lyase holo-[acyl-carrier protein] synthase [Caloramator sp. CAR-1]|uniref:citrate lyase holo-[acyl-carrier protein] synthase n=1 Tax=Caloramator sp. CAR-1 TaxID=3062777 RepID=UPI0026E307DD|nr:citrate lyase holo-[acyl-carrier protein] synthase [Caloramator sp. CAR-1]MDO6355201.1 citrate lyase holo-[acyl-carrier protein] synthase [Caloramator sp. CAR-1]
MRILEDREKRFLRILKLNEEYKLPVLCGKINYPGNDKNTLKAGLAFNVLYSLLKDTFKDHEVYSETNEGFDGKSLLMVLNVLPKEAKKKAVNIEEFHQLGRLFDIDIYVNGQPISRMDLGFKRRKCIVCGDDAGICTRQKRHDLREVIEIIDKIIDDYFGVSGYDDINWRIKRFYEKEDENC